MAFNLTKRQLLCFGGAAVLGIPAYLFLRPVIGNTAALFLMIGVMLPAFLLAMYEKDGLPFEKVVRNLVRARFLWPGTRPYKTENFYALLGKPDDEEVTRIVPNKKPARKQRRKKQKP